MAVKMAYIHAQNYRFAESLGYEAYRPRLDTRGLHYDERWRRGWTRRSLAEAKHPAPF
jgi:hypothetical protein